MKKHTIFALACALILPFSMANPVYAAENYLTTIDESGEVIRNEENPVKYPSEVENWEPLGWVTATDYERYLADKEENPNIYAQDYAYTGGYIASGDTLYGLYGQYETLIVRAYDVDEGEFVAYSAPASYFNEAIVSEPGTISEFVIDQEFTMNEIRNGFADNWDYIEEAVRYATDSDEYSLVNKEIGEIYADMDCTQPFDLSTPFTNGLIVYTKLDVSKQQTVAAPITASETNDPVDNNDGNTDIVDDTLVAEDTDIIAANTEPSDSAAPLNSNTDTTSISRPVDDNTRPFKVAVLVSGVILCSAVAGGGAFFFVIFKRKKKVVGSIVGVKVENPAVVLSRNEKVLYHTNTDEAGYFVFEDVEAGPYMLSDNRMQDYFQSTVL